MQSHDAKAIIKQRHKVLVDKLSRSHFDNTEFGVILNTCNVILSQHLNFRVVFASRKANTIAHVLASMGLLMNVTQTYHLAPLCIAETII